MSAFKKIVDKKRYEIFTKRLLKAAEGYDIAQIGSVGKYQIFKIVANPKAESHCVCFMAGLHGNEIAGPLGMLSFLEEKIYIPKNRKVVMFPLVNPSGFELDTRENEDGMDINRHFFDEDLTGECKQVWEGMRDENIDLLHTLHEDPDMKSFYVYYTHTKEMAVDIRDLAKKYFKIFGGDKREPLEGEEAPTMYNDKVYDGLIPLPHTVRGTIEDRVLAGNIPYITTETPGKELLVKRVRFNRDVMKLVINSLGTLP